ncbi:hypothetical protein K493DRAFT_362183 [Basidiobolus meristosporus CBS 931.73]|uniref:Uncharacterized protein n=1 Tax=Basidiobolus meristosporus CBS 931.73 TaxID=1314790 RepID=A0A1Y1X599_9FUNG|nr:hypothetical protein K493DRAFT_362183 [Basidiobolus meristosporus CBS 931.73]|eukprot:ORX80536.1 hypothetical protein K493DRAFT_362183 [Basidiobolus meristosporus CBS 931.73]
MEFQAARTPPGPITSILHPGKFFSFRKYKRDIVRYIEIPDMIHFTLVTIALLIAQAMAYIVVFLYYIIQSPGACVLTAAVTSYNGMSGIEEEDMNTARKVLLALKSSTFIAVLVGGFGIIIFATGIKYRFQRDLVQLRLGNYSLFHHRKGNKISMNNYLQFYGSALGNAFFASIVVIIQLFLLLVLLSLAILIESIRNFLLKWLLLSFLVPLIISAVTSAVISLITTLLFIIPGTKFWLKRRNGFMHWSYLAMFVHIPKGISGWLERMLKAFFTIFVFSSRVDRYVSHVNLRSGDGGYNAYLGLLLSEHYYYNPINMVFLCLMLGITHHEAPLKFEATGWRKLIRPPSIFLDDKQDAHGEMKSITIVTANLESRRLIARNRWHLAYTLINNPKLRDLRRRGEPKEESHKSG